MPAGTPCTVPDCRRPISRCSAIFPSPGKTRLQFRAEAFNVFNHTNLGTPERFVNTPQFGSVTMAATSARQIQFVARLLF